MRRSLMCPSWAIDVSWPVETMRFLSVTEPIVSGEKRWGKRGSEGIPPAPVDRVEGGEDAGLVALVSERGFLGKPDHVARARLDRALVILADAQPEGTFEDGDDLVIEHRPFDLAAVECCDTRT